MGQVLEHVLLKKYVPNTQDKQMVDVLHVKHGEIQLTHKRDRVGSGYILSGHAIWQVWLIGIVALSIYKYLNELLRLQERQKVEDVIQVRQLLLHKSQVDVAVFINLPDAQVLTHWLNNIS